MQLMICSTGGPFQLPEYFFWNPWQQFHKPGHWKSGLIDSWVILTVFIILLVLKL